MNAFCARYNARKSFFLRDGICVVVCYREFLIRDLFRGLPDEPLMEFITLGCDRARYFSLDRRFAIGALIPGQDSIAVDVRHRFMCSIFGHAFPYAR